MSDLILFQDWVLFLIGSNSLLLLIIIILLGKMSVLYKNFIRQYKSLVNSIALIKEEKKDIAKE